MRRLIARVNAALSGQLPEQRIYLRTENNTRYLRLSPLSQTMIGTVTVASLCWMVIASSTLAIKSISADSKREQLQVVQQDYATRLNQLSLERDQRALEAQKAQERFYVAMDQISKQQENLLTAEEKRRELATGLEIMQKKLQAASQARDYEIKRNQVLAAELAGEHEGGTQIGAAEDIADTLDIIATALDTAVIQRDSMSSATQRLSRKVADLEFEAQMREEQSEIVFAQLEDAVETSLLPMENLLKVSGVNPDNLLNEIRRQYSGTGGPLTPPLTTSTKGTSRSTSSKRVNTLLKNMDKINLMKLAARNLPLGMPVSGGFRYTSSFGPRWGRMHNGRDMAGRLGTPIVSSGDGVVIFAGRQSGYGNQIKVRHAQGFVSSYSHLNRIKVKAGQKVSRGQRIGDMGSTGRSTGVHLHYEIRIGGRPVNPQSYMKSNKNVF